MLTGRNETAVGIPRQAQVIAETHDAPNVISGALNTEAVATALLDREWVGLLDRALRIALTENLPSEAGLAYCDDHDLATYGTFLRSQRTSELERTRALGRGADHEPGHAALMQALTIFTDLSAAPAARLAHTNSGQPPGSEP